MEYPVSVLKLETVMDRIVVYRSFDTPVKRIHNFIRWGRVACPVCSGNVFPRPAETLGRSCSRSLSIGKDSDGPTEKKERRVQYVSYFLKHEATIIARVEGSLSTLSRAASQCTYTSIYRSISDICTYTRKRWTAQTPRRAIVVSRVSRNARPRLVRRVRVRLPFDDVREIDLAPAR